MTDTTFNIYFTIPGFLAALILASFVHELGHSIVALRLRVPIRRVTIGMGPILWQLRPGAGPEICWRLLPFSVSIAVPAGRTADSTACRPLGHDMAVAAGGPTASLLLAVALVFAAVWVRITSGAGTWAATTALLSAWMGLSNLFPLPGLDGGHILLLDAMRLGLVISPRQQVMVHRTGLRLVAVAVLSLGFVRLVSLA
jgi:membrane-associated protease RseP (regulator of RpoE activity)